MGLQRVSSLVSCGLVLFLAVGRESDVDGVERFDELHCK